MSDIKVNINGKELYGHNGQTIVQLAAENNIEIPTLCDDPRVQMYASCGVCVVEAEHTPKLIRACSTYIFDGMVVKTDTERTHKTRRAALELMLSDHRGDCKAPCILACPAQTDCQGYVGLVSLGEYDAALKLVKDKIPLPGSIGRVCPHPCEDACRRELVEEPISIASIKSFLGDKDMENPSLYTPETGADTGKKVAVIGGGPGGLTAAYFLRIKGHAVEIFDKMPQMGGMLYYGIPEYRLPNDYLTREVNSIRDMGVTFRNNVAIGKDLSLYDITDKFDATIIATGAWTSSPLGCAGEDLEGVIGGIDFLRKVVLNEEQLIGKNVAIVGGGNTAMDACRTAVRLGAEKVYNIYRRTKNEMPAEEIEIIEAEDEGVIFKNLTNPIEVQGKDGKVSAVRLQIMELGEPDSSGRRKPVAVKGKEETLNIDTLIVAIGQKLDTCGMDGVGLTQWNTILADENTFATNIEGVFAIGDATNKGADIAISAVGEAKKVADVIDSYFDGNVIPFKERYVVKQELTAEDFSDRAKEPRAKMPHRSANIRRDNFLEVNYGLTDELAMAEGARCLECGCHDFFECKLVDYANQYDVKPEKYAGDEHKRGIFDDHPYILRNPDKCILCGLCVRVCTEVVGETALGLVGRGFDTVVAPALELPLGESGCISCGQCVTVCPTGALLETMQIKKQIPTAEEKTVSTCSFCSVGCKQELTHTGNSLKRALPYNENAKDALLCVKGRFGFGEIDKYPRIISPAVKENDKFVDVDLRQAAVYTAKKLQAIQSVHGNDKVGIAVSSRYTSEEILAIKHYANSVLGVDNVFSFGETPSGIAKVLGRDSSTASFGELENTDMVLLVQMDIHEPHLIAGLHVKKAAENGAKLLVLNDFESAVDEYCSKKYDPQQDLSLLKGILKVVLEKSEGAKTLAGFKELSASLKNVKPSGDAVEIADEYLGAKKAVIIFEQGKLTTDAAVLLANIAFAAGKSDSARSGIVQLKPGANSQGLANLGIKAAEDVDIASLKGLVIFGENPEASLVPELEFLAVHELHLTDTASRANIVLPAQSFAEVNGSFTSAVGVVSAVNKAVEGPVDISVLALVSAMSEVMEKAFPYTTVAQLSHAVKIYSGERKAATTLVVADSNKLKEEHPITNQLAISVMKVLS